MALLSSKELIMLGGAKILSGASFCELCAPELKCLPPCRDTVHYLNQDCIKRGQLSETPAARPVCTHRCNGEAHNGKCNGKQDC